MIITLASAPDFAMAVGKPMAISDCFIFRHFHVNCPSVTLPIKFASKICNLLERMMRFFGSSKEFIYHSLKEIIQNGDKALQRKRELWNQGSFCRHFEKILNTIFDREKENIKPAIGSVGELGK